MAEAIRNGLAALAHARSHGDPDGEEGGLPRLGARDRALGRDVQAPASP